MRAKVGLIAYADRFGTDLAGLRGLLDGPLRGLFGGVHVLPFYRPYDGADAGFDPQDHTEVDERLGSWGDISALGGEYQVMADMIVNHVSSGSAPFQDWLARGDASPYAGMFLTYGTVFPGGATEEDLLRLYRPRPGLPFTPYVLAGGRKALVWTTFTPEQIDVDARHPATQAYVQRILDRLAAAGVSHVRLDAVGYAVKTPGLSSFMTPETFKFIAEVAARCHDRGIGNRRVGHGNARDVELGRENRRATGRELHARTRRLHLRVGDRGGARERRTRERRDDCVPDDRPMNDSHVSEPPLLSAWPHESPRRRRFSSRSVQPLER